VRTSPDDPQRIRALNGDAATVREVPRRTLDSGADGATMVWVSGDADFFAPDDPLAPTDNQAITDRAGFLARVGSSVDRAHDLAHDIVGDAQVAAEVVRGVLDARWARRDELTDDDLRLEPILLATRAAALHRRTTQPAPTGAPATGIDQPSSASAQRVELAQASAAVLGADDASALDLHLRHGIEAAALAATLGVSTADAPQRLARLRSRLDDALAAFTLWRGGSPVCAELGASLHDGTALDDGRFDIVAFDTVSAHRAGCADCARLHRSIVNPAGMFVAAPVMAVAPSMRDRMLSLGGSTSSATEPVAPIPRRNSDDTPTALLWAAAESSARAAAPAPGPARPRAATPIIHARHGDLRRLLAGVAAALLLLLTGGAVIAVRGSSGDGDRTDATTTTTGGPTESTEPEVRALGPVPPVVAVTSSTTTTTAPPDTTEPATSDASTSTPETTSSAVASATTAPRRSSSAPSPTVATTTAVPDIDSGTPVPPPPTATTTPTTTAPTTTTQTTAPSSTTTTSSTTIATTTTVATTVATTIETTIATTIATTTAPP
jgi:hypothetical protein